MILKFQQYINESNATKIIAYHGSPYLFDKFDKNHGIESMQLGADIGFWFTTDKKVALQFAQTFPKEMYQKMKDIQNTKKEEISKQKEHAIKQVNFNILLDYLKDTESNIFNIIQSEYTSKDYNGLEKSLLGLLSYIGRRNLPSAVLDEIEKYLSIDKKYDEILKKEQDIIKQDYINNHKGTLYICELSLGKSTTIQGEDIGTNWNRFGFLDSASEEYDSIIIKNADTGQGIADEIVVFDPKNIKITKKESI